MKKTILALSLIVMALSAGCSDTKTNDAGEQQESNPSETEDLQTENKSAENTDSEVMVNTQGTGTASAGQQPEEPDGSSPSDQEEQKPEAERPELNLTSEDWGLGFGEEGSQPTGNASAEALKPYDAYYIGSADEKVIYLTFDCGYENGNTEPILDALKKHNAPATFFVVGHFLETAPELVKRMIADGHAVGNHTYHHLEMNAISEKEKFQKELEDVSSLFHEVTGAELSEYYRPPQGKCNVKNLEMAQELGYRTIFWSLAHVDWNTDNQPSREEAMKKLTSRIHPGAIVLLHNTSRTNGEIMDELLTKWEEMGYSFRPLSELVE